MPKAFPPEFRRDVVAVARKAEALLRQIAKDFGISESCLHQCCTRPTWMTGCGPGSAQRSRACTASASGPAGMFSGRLSITASLRREAPEDMVALEASER